MVMTTAEPQPARAADVLTSLIRTWVPVGVGALLTWFAASTHTGIPPRASATVGALVAAALSAGYYAIARLLERTTSTLARDIGRWMLGGAVPPLYLDAAHRARIMR
jgi:hypothetical protein